MCSTLLKFVCIHKAVPVINSCLLALLPIIAETLLRTIILRAQLLRHALLAVHNALLALFPDDPQRTRKRKRPAAAL